MSQTEREQLRAQNGLVPVSKEDEGLSWSKISNGVFGFTYTPADSDGGIFAKDSLLSFEFHKLSDGSMQFLGYTTPEFADKMKTGNLPEVELFPVAKESFNVLVVVPKSRIASHKPLDRENSNKLKLVLRNA
jgi:hypothetical protein